jgi:effector-binding domain-containing protein
MKWSTDMLDLGYPLGRFMGLFMNGMMQSYYKKGFENLNALLANLPAIDLQVQQLEKRSALLIKDSAMVNDVGAKMGTLFGELSAFMQKNKIEMAGYPFCIYYSWDYTKPFVMECAIPITAKVPTSGRIVYRDFEPTKVAKTIHKGSYESTAKTHENINTYLNINKIEIVGFPWEVYVTDPTTEPDTSKWITEIYYPIR